MLRLLIVALTCLWIGPAAAQDWPTRPITMVVPFPAGGPVDLVARLLSQRLSDALGQQVIVENIGGAGGMNGAARVARAAPDGYAFVFGTQGSHTFSQMIYKKPLYNAVADFTPGMVVVENAKVLLVRKDFPANNFREFVDYAKANHGKLQFGSAGTGSATHITCVLLNSKIGVNVVHVPYRGTAPAMQDVIGGRIDYICEITSTGAPHVRSKAVKPIAILSMDRSAAMPEVPTAHEQGLANFDADGWNAFFFPKGTPMPIVRKVVAATSAIIDVPEVKARLEGAGLIVPPPARRTPEHLGKLVVSELEKWGPAVKESGARAD